MKLKITVNEKLYEVEVEAEEQEPVSQIPYAPGGGGHFAGPVAPIPMSAPMSAGPGDGPEDKICRSPIVGVVVRLNAQEAQEVQKDDPLLVLEAMKMETTITSPVNGKIKAFRVHPGESVQGGQVLVDFE